MGRSHETPHRPPLPELRKAKADHGGFASDAGRYSSAEEMQPMRVQVLDHRNDWKDPQRGQGMNRDKARVIYLSGPMKGYPESNYPLFHRVAADLRAEGHRVYSPHEFAPAGPLDQTTMRKAFAEYSKFICLEADTIVLLPGWEKSKGVSAEKALAENCGLDVIEWAAT